MAAPYQLLAAPIPCSTSRLGIFLNELHKRVVVVRQGLDRAQNRLAQLRGDLAAVQGHRVPAPVGKCSGTHQGFLGLGTGPVVVSPAYTAAQMLPRPDRPLLGYAAARVNTVR